MNPTPLRRIKIIVQFDGAPFHGWQFQAGQPTVQETVERALEQLLGEPTRLFAAGRTDTGVHAAAMPCHFNTQHQIPAHRIPVAILKYLPDSVSIQSAADMPLEWDARRTGRMRWYRYQVLLNRIRRPLAPRAWQFYKPLDLSAIEEGLTYLRGEHDFQGFRSGDCKARRTRLNLREATMMRQGDLLAFDFKCRSFLHHQIRYMMGTLVSMGRGLMDVPRLLRIRDNFQHPEMILCAPPQGLCLMAVGYTPEECEAILNAHPEPPSF